MRVPDIVRVCADRGLKYIGITDHIFPATDPGILRQTRKALDEIADDRGLSLYLGCEADVTAVGSHEVCDEVLSIVDYVMVAANHFHAPWVDSPRGDSASEVAQHHLRIFAYACSLTSADTIAHPLCELTGNYKLEDLNAISDAGLAEALQSAKTNSVAVEISPRSLHRMHPDFRRRFYGMCREIGVKFSIGSDAHCLEHAGQTFLLQDLISELGITDDEIWLPTRKSEREAALSVDHRPGRV